MTDLYYLVLHLLSSGNASRGGMRLNISTWRAYALELRNIVSVPWMRSSTPRTPKHWLNLLKARDCTSFRKEI